MLLDCACLNLSMEAHYRYHGGLAPDSLFVHIDKYSIEDIVRLADQFYETCLDLLKKTGYVFEEVVVALDMNDVEHWGVDEDSCKTIGKKIIGSSRVHRYATVSIVKKGFRFTIACVPVRKGEKHEDVVEKLLVKAMRLVPVSLVMMDRGFYNTNVLKKVEELGLCYLVHVKKNKSIYALFKKTLLDGTRTALYTMNQSTRSKRKTITLFFKEHPKYEYMVMACNKQVTTEEIDVLFELYRDRWNIETGYREKNSFKIRTCSKKHQYRVLLYTISHLLMNLTEVMRRTTRFSKEALKTIVRMYAGFLHEQEKMLRNSMLSKHLFYT